MTINRREALRALGGAAALGALGRLEAQVPAVAGAGGAGAQGVLTFPRKADFDIAEGYTYINGAFTHPMPRVAAEAARRSVENRSTLGAPPPAPGSAAARRVDPRALFAELINAKPTEISTIPNTSWGENLVVESLGIRKFDGNVVTDALHFDGALVHLHELQKQGLDLRLVKHDKDYRIDLRDLEKVIDRKTRLVEVSLVAMFNGFQHDLKAVCDLAHANGAYVYADIVQGAGAVPFDVKATGVDFCACSSFKWLMGDFGLGFFYAREELLGKVVQRPHWGYHSTRSMTGHFGPFDPDAATKPVSWELRDDASGYFEVGSIDNGSAAALGASLQYIKELGVERIQAHRQPLLKQLREELPRLGYPLLTPPDSTSPIITFGTKDGVALNRKLQAARVNVRVSRYWLRLSPSVYNDMADVDRLLEAIA
jgi:selenocysteine lyase/cysteine desulfurase